MSSGLVSVVTGVYNGAGQLASTLDCILAQQGVDLEFILVNDGSTDNSGDILREYAAADSRIKVVDFPTNQGLTRALIAGCRAATGDYIARQDVGDYSYPTRLQRQLALIETDPSIVLVSCGTRFLGPAGEWLFTQQPESEAADRALRHASQELRGPPCHPCTLFRADVYRAVGGYRPEFVVAQDMDLWTRMVEKGRHAVVQESLYDVILDVGGISSLRLPQQRRAREAVIACMQARSAGDPEEPILQELVEWTKSQGQQLSARLKSRRKRRAEGAFYYFVGNLLRARDSRQAAKYLGMAVKRSPMELRYWLRLAQAWVTGLAANKPG